MTDRALVVHATNLLLGGFDAGSDPANALAHATGALRRALAFREPTFAVALVDEAPLLDDAPHSLLTQHERLPSLLATHGFSVVVAPEPMHLAAAYTRAAIDAGMDVIVVATDKRLAQLVSGRVWWYDPFKRVRYTPELVRKRFDVAPDRVAGWLAMVGDRETLPGVKGLGKKGVTDLVHTYGSVEAAIAHAEDVEGRSGKALRASLTEARIQLRRALLQQHRPRPVPLSSLPWTPPSVADLNGLYSELGFHHLLQAEGDDEAATVCASEADVGAVLASLDDSAPTAVLAVTEDPSPARGALVGLALAQADVCAYVPVAHLNALATWLEDAETDKVGHATKSVRVAVARQGITLRGVVGDSESASHLTDPTGLAPHDLDALARQVLHAPVMSVDEVRGVGKFRKRWGELTPAQVAALVGPWASASLALHERFAPGIDPAQMTEYLALSDTLASMELHGVVCDAEDLAQSGADFSRIEADVEAQIHDIAGRAFNVGSTKQLGTVLFER
ncbi:MAG: hypothetical protein KDA24_25125, partial [Deltaproteobacteria bacterium]|nr:hypothetical protein [Deltaproteobacteria bacterium]